MIKKKFPVESIIGGLLGVSGVVAALVLWKALKGSAYSLDKVDSTVSEAIQKLEKSAVSKPRKNRLVVEKKDRATILLRKMKPRIAYTQVQLQKMSGYTYRSVRRYMDHLIAQKRIIASGYGRGKVFTKQSS